MPATTVSPIEMAHPRDETTGDDGLIPRIEYILQARVTYRKTKTGVKLYWQYHVKWVGLTHEFDSWEHEGLIERAGAAGILDRFWAEIDKHYSASTEEAVRSKGIMYAGRRVFPSEEWIDECKADAIKARDQSERS
ncbi:hypothetical protein AURDEDRAFT_162684 [Auricularia subglabra TFB-10046 SS5]|nr:hypothetical protein AURDEDRAFT_162684 [Auricularia subglabra TFB-10046 SS5]